jgi:hypothetical protein
MDIGTTLFIVLLPIIEKICLKTNLKLLPGFINIAFAP